MKTKRSRKTRTCFKVVDINNDFIGYACSTKKTKRGIYGSMRRGGMKGQVIVRIDRDKRVVHVA